LKLVEKHAQKAVSRRSRPTIAPRGHAVAVDALIGGQMHFGIAACRGLATLWDKTVGTANEVRALCAAQAMPFISLQPSGGEVDQGLPEGDKIAVPGIKNSNQAICLADAAAKEWGQAANMRGSIRSPSRCRIRTRRRDHLEVDRTGRIGVRMRQRDGERIEPRILRLSPFLRAASADRSPGLNS